jgi:hypothetical protein
MPSALKFKYFAHTMYIYLWGSYIPLSKYAQFPEIALTDVISATDGWESSIKAVFCISLKCNVSQLFYDFQASRS